MKIQTEFLVIQEGGSIETEAGVEIKHNFAWSLLIPRFATANLPNPIWVEGGIAYDTTLNKLVISNGTAWETVTSAAP